jgi:RNA polymerase sigma-70 factor (ECF subfamily)
MEKVASSTIALRDESLIIQKAIVDTDAFMALYDRYFSRVYTYFRYRCQDQATCDDLTAQTFEQALVHIREYCPHRGAFAAWLFGIARNTANAHLRKKLRYQWLPIEALWSLPGNEPHLEELVIEADRQHLLAKCLLEMSPRQQDLLALKFAGELNNRQIADLTGLSEQNVGVILYRSIQYLRKRMEQAEDYHGA